MDFESSLRCVQDLAVVSAGRYSVSFKLTSWGPTLFPRPPHCLTSGLSIRVLVTLRPFPYCCMETSLLHFGYSKLNFIKSLNFFINTFLMCMSILLACISVHYMCLGSTEPRRGCWIRWELELQQLWATRRVLGIKHGSSTLLTAEPSFQPFYYVRTLLVCVCENASTTHIEGRKLCRRRGAPSTWVLGVKLTSLGLVAGFSCQGIV